MVQRTLTAKELSEINFADFKTNANRDVIAKAIENGSKILAKKVDTLFSSRVDIYMYDSDLHRYVKVESWWLCK